MARLYNAYHIEYDSQSWQELIDVVTRLRKQERKFQKLGLFPEVFIEKGDPEYGESCLRFHIDRNETKEETQRRLDIERKNEQAKKEAAAKRAKTIRKQKQEKAYEDYLRLKKKFEKTK